jgi:hypothetical protein
MITDAWQSDVPDGLAALRARLIATNPALQASLVHRMLAGQADLVEALCAAFPDELSVIEAAALVGGMLGAINAAALASLQQGDRPDEVRAAMTSAAGVVFQSKWG